MPTEQPDPEIRFDAINVRGGRYSLDGVSALLRRADTGQALRLTMGLDIADALIRQLRGLLDRAEDARAARGLPPRSIPAPPEGRRLESVELAVEENRREAVLRLRSQDGSQGELLLATEDLRRLRNLLADTIAAIELADRSP